MVKAWEVTKTVFSIIGLAAFVAGLTILVVVMGRKTNETIDTDFPTNPVHISGMESALGAGKERMAALFQRIRMGKSGSAGMGGNGVDGKGSG